MASDSTATIYQFKIELIDTTPIVWRQVQVPSTFDMFDLHAALNDAMGWEDYHYHVFKVHNLNTKPKRIDHVGRPIEKLPKGPVDGNSVKMTTYFKKPGDAAEYWYDFGDRWEHKVVLQKIFPAEANKSYPRCVDGRRACPPEDCGGTEGYENFLRVLGNKKDPEHASTKNWLKNNRKHADFSPDKFDATSVIFRPKEARQYPYQNTAEANFYVYITMM